MGIYNAVSMSQKDFTMYLKKEKLYAGKGIMTRRNARIHLHIAFEHMSDPWLNIPGESDYILANPDFSWALDRQGYVVPSKGVYDLYHMPFEEGYYCIFIQGIWCRLDLRLNWLGNNSDMFTPEPIKYHAKFPYVAFQLPRSMQSAQEMWNKIQKYSLFSGSVYSDFGHVSGIELNKLSDTHRQLAFQSPGTIGEMLMHIDEYSELHYLLR